MENEAKTRNIVFILVLAIIIIVILMVLAIVYIWSPKSTNKVQEVEQGQYEVPHVTEKQMAEKYSKQIGDILLSKNYDKLYNLLTEEYKKTFNMTEEKFKNYIDGKGLIGREVKCKRYAVQKLRGERVYKLTLTDKSGLIDFDIILLEESPGIYKINFDDYIYSRNLNEEFIKNGFKLTILREELNSTSIKLQLKIENLTGYPIVLNSNSQKAALYTKILGKDVDIKTDFLSATSKEIGVNESIEFAAEILVSDFSHKTVSGIVVKDVLVKNGSSKSNIEFPYSVNN